MFEIRNSPRRSSHRPRCRAGVVQLHNAYFVPSQGVTIHAWPDRSLSAARALARRVYRDPRGYLAIIHTYNVPGVVLTPTTTAARAA